MTSGGVLAGALNSSESILINSLHLQGVDRVGEGVTVEATASDGLVEALSIDRATAFCLGVQWHPEALPDNPVSVALFDTFVDACRR